MEKEYGMQKKEKELLKKIIRVRSVNSMGGGEIADKVLDFLDDSGAEYTHRIMKFEKTKNLVVFSGEGEEATVLNGHYDVVPANRDAWGTDPFDLREEGGFLYGRGACDMKGPLVSLVSAFSEFASMPEEKKNHRVILMLVGDEEVIGENGTKRVLETLMDEGIKIRRALIGEPNAREIFGDSIKTGRRGVLRLLVKLKGKSGHAAWPDVVNNPILASARLIKELQSLALSTVGKEKVPTTVSPTFINSDGKATNIVPGEADLKFDIRYNHMKFPEKTERLIEHTCEELGCRVSIEREVFTHPFSNHDGEYENHMKNLVRDVFGIEALPDMRGGASDAAYFSHAGIPVLEMGPKPYNEHGTQEKVSIEGLGRMKHFVSKFLGVS